MTTPDKLVFDDKEASEILRKCGKGFERIVQIRALPAVGKNENYSGELLRLSVTVEEEKTGRRAERSIILKQKREVTASNDISEFFKVFEVETIMYGNLFKLYDEILVQYHDKEGKIWADYVASAKNKLFLEDLKELGYTLTAKEKGHDLHHSLLVVKNLGKLHALSLAAVHNKKFDVESLGPSAFAMDAQFMTTFYANGIYQLCEYLEKNRNEEWPDLPQKLRNSVDNMGQKLRKLYESSKGKFDVINHGDCWSNNIMFKYMPGANIPHSLRFVDFQISHYNSPGWDLNNYIYNSVRFQQRKDHLETLLSAYTDSLRENCQKFGYTGQTPSLEEVKAAFDEVSYFGMLVNLVQVPLIMSMGEKDFKLDMNDMADGGTEDAHYSYYHLEAVVREIKEALHDFIERKVI